MFRTAYECAQSHLSFAEHPRLINLQKLNGVKCGNLLHSRQSCANITGHISVEMLSEIAKHIISNKVQFSVLVDESTSVANVQSLIVYLRTLFNGDACVYFLGLLPVESATAAGLEKTLLDFLHSIGLTDDIMREQFIGFCSDGASTMTGEHNGLATLLSRKFPGLKSFHCMAHRLELAVKNTVDAVNPVSHLRSLIEGIYKVYSLSPKNQREN